MNRSQALRELALLENYEFDRGDAPVRILTHLSSSDLDVGMAAVRAATAYMGLPGIWERIFELAQGSPVIDIRASANAALWPIMQEGGFWDWKPEPSEETDETELIEPTTPREVYEATKAHLLARVDSPDEPGEVRRRCLESLGHVAFLPEVRQIVLRHYREADSQWEKISSLFAMGLQQDDEFESIVLEELNATEPGILCEAIHSAASMALEEAWPMVASMLDHPNKDVRYEAIAAVGWLAPMEEIESLLEGVASEHKDEWTREAIELARLSQEERRREEAGEDPDDGWRMEQVWDEIDRMTDGTVRSDDEDESDGPRPGRARR